MSPTNDSAIHIQAIRRALANGNAAVMVGAGFSRNAEGGDQFKMWTALGAELWVALNPDVNVPRLSPAQVTQLAEQYARVFSTPALEDLLKRHIPDDRVAPGGLHQKLLELPWCEIFTTNYDTLLERAADPLLDRAHFTVCSREDIPQSKILGRRRIVKLHGSFPSHRPFIFTEEDYRQYPVRSAPFVNLVRQSLLENVFCLIGFSGEDPNFLHWIGWVRDMLDRHALPIYLLTDREPTLGERILLEARRVTPVTLPYPSDNADADYAVRLGQLFRQLSQPLKPAPTEWGRLPWQARVEGANDTDADRFERALAVFPQLTQLCESYPGWMVAPSAVRRRFKGQVEALPLGFEGRWLWEHLDGKQPPPVGVVFLSQYVWVQDTLLLPLLDHAAQLGVRLLRTTARLALDDHPECRAVLHRLGAHDQRAFDRCWRRLALGLMQWARQGMLESLYLEICDLIRATCPKDLEATDQMHHELILLRLYQGERQEARTLLSRWQVRSADPYMKFRKGVLLAETGNAEAAFELCSEAISLLRRQQKIRPESLLLASQEAWACLVVSRMWHGWNLYGSLVDATAERDDESESVLNRRLADLAAKGFDARAELNAATAALYAEAAPPSEPRYEVGDFDLGQVRTFRHLTWSSELTEKTAAAFAWLALTERVGFIPRFGEISNQPGSFTKAAWWIQFEDSIRRMFSIVIRTMSAEIFKPKDLSLSRDRTGWLSRYQVAQLDPEFAEEMCARAVRQVEVALATSVDVQRTTEFYLELFSRLVLRIQTPDKVLALAERVVSLHHQIATDAYSRLWSVFARALARCLEALPGSEQLDVICKVTRLPLLPSVSGANHFLSEWLQPHRLDVEPILTREVPASLSSHVDDLIELLRNEDPQTIGAAWERLVWLDACSALTARQRSQVGAILWRAGDTWPVMPHFTPFATTRWPPPNPGAAPRLFREWILKEGVLGFRSPSMWQLHLQAQDLSWGLPGDHTFFESWLAALSMESWPEAAWVDGLRQTLQWWQAESTDLIRSVERHEELSSAVKRRLDLIDKILGNNELWNLSIQSSEVHSLLRDEIAALVDATSTLRAPFWRFRIQRARHAQDIEAQRALERDLAAALMSPANASVLHQATDAARLWIEESDTPTAGRPSLLINTAIGVLTSRTSPALAVILGMFINLLKNRIQVFDENAGVLVDLALKALSQELTYATRTIGSGIPNEEVPLLRFQCVRLSWLIIETEAVVHRSAAEEWVRVADGDPLPEMRFRRYQVALRSPQK